MQRPKKPLTFSGHLWQGEFVKNHKREAPRNEAVFIFRQSISRVSRTREGRGVSYGP